MKRNKPSMMIDDKETQKRHNTNLKNSNVPEKMNAKPSEEVKQ